MENKQLGLLMSAFIAIIIGLVLITPTADKIEDVSVSSILFSNDTVALNSTGAITDGIVQQTGTLGSAGDEYEILSLSIVRNESDAKDITSYCDLTFATWTLNCTGTGSATAYVDYNYEPDDYVKSTAASTIIRLTIIFFAIAVLTIGIGYAWKALRDSGMI